MEDEGEGHIIGNIHQPVIGLSLCGHRADHPACRDIRAVEGGTLARHPCEHQIT